MSEITTIRLRDNGPLLVEGQVEIIDAVGNKFSSDGDKPKTALCRCGASGNKPFCDGSHRDTGFHCVQRAE